MRRPEEPEAVPDAPEPEPEPEPDPKWSNRDEGFERDMALLAKVKPVRPEERALRLSGRAYVIAALSDSSTNNVGNDFLRVGTDLTIENPFERGGRIRAQVEVDYLTKSNENEEVDILIPRLSYAWGGTRFDPTRWEAGRFLQQGMPEFGFLDGVEYGVRRESGHRYGASLGFMPEPGEDFESFNDFQFAAFYEYVSGVREELTLTAGFQKTLHNGTADRDLLIVKGRYLPGKGWDLLATVWIDFYTGKGPRQEFLGRR
ncbi:MAG: hypothetical protein HC813_02585 [Planctomycetes bacterium]|nr:hypothetical protein [Planctomycetota bacterium]